MKKWLCVLLAAMCLLMAGCASGPLTEDGAIKAASKYWDMKPGDVVSIDGGEARLIDIRVVEPPANESTDYVVALQQQVSDNQWTVIEVIWVNAETGEISTSPN